MSGVTAACLGELGKQPAASDALIRVIGADKTPTNFFSKEVGSGSRKHVLAGENFIRLVITFLVTGAKRLRRQHSP